MRLSYARQAIHDSTIIGIRSGDDADQVKYGCRIQRSTMSSSNNRILDVTEAGRILRAVEKCGPVVEAWIMYAYAAQPEKMSRWALVIEHVFRIAKFEDEPNSRWLRLMKLIEVAMDDYRLRMNTGRSLPVAAYCAHMTNSDGKPLHESNFVDRGWAGRARAVHKILEELDRQGVVAAAEEVRKLNGEQEREQVLKPVTVWERGYRQGDGMRWERSHEEDGHVEDKLPRPIYIEQVKSWRGADGWRKTLGYLNEGGKFVAGTGG